ncbi:metal ABC transporter solute-binding protein, Zn/Mn family [Clostridium sp. ZS2-4]|uniref:metal ABC transporter solute-binding protein, Zn/Mn family n=1 Tax=Clostridium sp. ZS2-4 TaxID=2987703 RepID=UPI00227A573F|nr:zinc ABC transporter substrate-binding protein [Clostridium sp. ZS2-4]MCY6355451.1 zinc ABC transporter substrate-binding protein [Clostridium sp. ZS2-4]
MKIFLKNLSLLILLTACIFLVSCSSEKTTSKCEISEKLSVAVSIVPEKTFVKVVAGGLADVVTMIPSGQSPENFQPTPDLIERFSKAKIYFSIGVPTESSSILPKAKDLNSSLKIINLDKEVAKIYPDREFTPGKRDPHIWLSPKRTKIIINTIKEQLSQIDPSNKSIYEKNAEEYIKKLDKIDNDIKSSLTNLKNKSIIVYHPAFGYFCDEYGLNMIALEAEGKDAQPQNLQKIIDMAKEKEIKTIFYQAEIDSKQSKTFADEINGKAQLIAPLSPDYIENLEKIANVFKQVSN